MELSTYSPYTDTELLALLSVGNKDAFNVLYLRHWEDLYKSAFFILRDQEASKDIVQDIFVWVWQHRQDLEINSVKSYLKAAVKFKVANYIRSGNIRESFFDKIAKFTPSTSANVEEFAELKELNGIVQQAISQLPPKCHEVFKLKKEGYLTNQEIASRLNISVKTVENHMTIALRRIRSAVEPHQASLLLLVLSIIYLK